jgi:hypothetical protein
LSHRKRPWDDKGWKFPHKEAIIADHYDEETDEEITEFIDEAQDALSKLFLKTNKRDKTLKAPRKKDAWQ